MITTLPPQTSRPPKTTRSPAASQPATLLASDYRLLGLRPREARVEVIREAVQQASNQIQLDQAARILTSAESDESPAESQQRLAEVAIAGYRLLDPRRRRTLFERVQLLMWTEEELDATVKSMWTVQPEAPTKVKIALPPARRAEREESSDDENLVALELFRNLRKRDRRALALWISLAGLTLSLVGALALFALFA